MTTLIPNTFADKIGTVQLQALDENFTQLATDLDTEIAGIQNQLDTDIASIQTQVDNIEDPVAMGLVFGPDPIPPIEPGTVVQVVQTVFKTTWSSSSNGTSFYPVTGFTASITPKFDTSKILVMLNMHISTGYWEVQGRLTRNTADITDSWGDARGSRARCSFAANTYSGSSTGYSWYNVAYQYLDSPATTSATTYGVSLNGYSSYSIAVNYNIYNDNNDADFYGQPISTITLMEISQ